MVLNAFKRGIFSLKQTKCTVNLGMLTRVAHVPDLKVLEPTSLKVLSPKQMLQRLPVALAQVQVGITSENLPNEIHQIIYSLHQAKEITKKRT